MVPPKKGDKAKDEDRVGHHTNTPGDHQADTQNENNSFTNQLTRRASLLSETCFARLTRAASPSAMSPRSRSGGSSSGQSS